MFAFGKQAPTAIAMKAIQWNGSATFRALLAHRKPRRRIWRRRRRLTSRQSAIQDISLPLGGVVVRRRRQSLGPSHLRAVKNLKRITRFLMGALLGPE